MDHLEREITEPTRRKIADELSLQGMSPNGQVNEVEFFSRLFNLNELPTRDHRTHQFPNMVADLWQHRVNNPMDWPDGWWWTDDRLALLHAPDETFLRFLAEQWFTRSFVLVQRYGKIILKFSIGIWRRKAGRSGS